MSELVLEGVPDLEELEAEAELRDLVRFVPRMSPRYMAPTHLAPLLRRFELAVDGVPQRVCCSAPPRHAKSESVFHVPAFMLRRHPEKTLSYSTYGERLSRKGSRKARAICTAAGLHVEGNVNEWRTPEGGGLLAGGVGGPLTGFGVDLAIVDDPTKNRLEAESAIYRDRLVDWYRDVLMSRIEPGGSVFVFATRWHPDDLIGQLIAEDPTDCRIEAEQRIADQLVELIDTHQVQLQALLKVEREGGQHDEAALAKATHDLETMQEEIDGNDDALASCEKEAGQ